ncbi:MAG: 50S ribosomal protein L11 methyltransferase, partial [Zetaproteobacteria bacterium]
MQAWWEVAALPEAEPERFAALAEAVGASVCEEQAPDGRVIARRFWVPEDARGTVERAARALGLGERIRLARLSEDWRTAWQRHWRAQPIGRRLWVRPPFAEAAPRGRLDLVIAPSMAFGTGTHPTTQLCLAAIEALVEQEAIRSLLDVGTGSGVLGIAAALLGVPEVVAIDCDPVAVREARANAMRNGVRISLACGDRPPRRRFDLVVANILLAPLVALAPELAAATRRWLVLSGIEKAQLETLISAYAAEGLRVVQSQAQSG